MPNWMLFFLRCVPGVDDLMTCRRTMIWTSTCYRYCSRPTQGAIQYLGALQWLPSLGCERWRISCGVRLRQSRVHQNATMKGYMHSWKLSPEVLCAMDYIRQEANGSLIVEKQAGSKNRPCGVIKITIPEELPRRCHAPILKMEELKN